MRTDKEKSKISLELLSESLNEAIELQNKRKQLTLDEMQSAQDA